MNGGSMSMNSMMNMSGNNMQQQQQQPASAVVEPGARACAGCGGKIVER